MPDCALRMEKTRNSFFPGGKGGLLKPVVPYFCPRLFSTIRKKGASDCWPKIKKGTATQNAQRSTAMANIAAAAAFLFMTKKGVSD